MTGPLTENVIYTYAPQDNPEIRYHSVPLSCNGAADTLADARTAYRADLAGLLHVGRRELPPVVEHVETKVHGMLVREKVGAVHRDQHADRMFLQTLLADGTAQQELRAYLDRAGGDGIEPVVVLADAHDPVASVLDQMTAADAVVVAYSDPGRDVGWAAIYGPEAQAAVGLPRVDAGPMRRLTVDALADRYPQVRVSELSHAC